MQSRRQRAERRLMLAERIAALAIGMFVGWAGMTQAHPTGQTFQALQGDTLPQQQERPARAR